MRRGYLTVYLSLMLTIILSLILTLVEGARISGDRMKVECVTDIAMNSVLAEYNRELLKQYDLLFVDLSYGSNSYQIENAESHLKHYLNQNLKPLSDGILNTRSFHDLTLSQAKITEYAVATDDNAEILRRQIADYMKTTATGIAEEYVGALIPDIGENAIFSGEIFSSRDASQAVIDSAQPYRIESEDGEVEEIPVDNPAATINSMRGTGVLNLVAGSKEISSKAVDLSGYASHRSIHKASGVCAEEKDVGEPCSSLQLQSYLFQKCGYYDHEKENSVLSYQIEYVIKGNGSDWKNLEEVCRTILLWREAANAIYLYTDATKMEEINAMAAGLSIVTFCPELYDSMRITILFAWAFLEALQDVRTLLGGGRVPLMKSADTWKTSLAGIANPQGELTDSDSGSGLSYQEYLQIMLFFTSEKDKVFHLMDLIEMDVRVTPGNAGLRLDYCLHSFEAEIVVNSGFGGTTKIVRRYGYYYAN